MAKGCDKILVPTTTNFKVPCKGELAQFVATVNYHGENYRFELMPPKSSSMSHAFVIRTIDDDKKVNCMVDHIQVTIPLKFGEKSAATKITCDVPIVKTSKNVAVLDELMLPRSQKVAKVQKTHEFKEEGAPKKKTKIE